MKKVFTLILAVCIVFSYMPTVFAESETVIISSADDFMNFIGKLSDNDSINAVISADIDLSGKLSQTNPLSPIARYNGTITGNGHTISGLYISSDDNAALFLELGENSSVSNITLEGYVSGNNAASVSYINNGEILYVKNKMTIVGKNMGAGISIYSYNTSKITNSENYGLVTAVYDVAGIVAWASGLISNTANYGNISGESYIGGIAGAILSDGCEISYCTNYGNITGTVKNIGGIVGSATGGPTTVSYCVNKGVITGTANTADIVGKTSDTTVIIGSDSGSSDDDDDNSSSQSIKAVALTTDNPTLKYDVYATIKQNKVYFFMPSTADISNLTIRTISHTGEISEAVKYQENMTLNENETVYSVIAMQSNLPSLIFNINEEYGTIEAMNTCPDHETKCFGDVILEVPQSLTDEKGWEGFVSKENDAKKNGTMEIKGRGNSTWTWDQPGSKLPYQFKLEKKTDVLNMGKHKTWIILKNDEELIRNKLGFDLGQMMGLTNSSNGEFVDVFLNGEYLGNYLLCEKVEIDETRVDITNLDDAYEDNGDSVEGLDMTGGYLLEIDNWGGDDLQIRHESSYTTISIKEPEDLAKTATSDNEYGYITNYMTTWLDAVYSDGIMPDGRSYLDYIDTESFVTYFFHQEFLRNGDCGRGSTYMYKDCDSVDPLIYAGPIWDNDRIYEQVNNVEGWRIATINHAGTDFPTLYNKLNHRYDFARLLIEYYENSSISEIFAQSSKLVYEYIDDIGVSGKMNAIRWDLTDFDPSWIADVMDSRAKWIDENYLTLLDIAEYEFINSYTENDTVYLNVYNNTDNTLTALVFVAQYKDGVLLKTDTFKINNLEIGKLSETLSAQYASDADTIKIYTWDNSIAPIYKKLTIK